MKGNTMGRQTKKFHIPPSKFQISHSTLQIPIFLFLVLLAVSCSFDYGQAPVSDSNTPDVVMKDVEYVRVRNGEPQVRFYAELAERYEKRRTMELKKFSFEQFGSRDAKIDAIGRAGEAHVELESGNINLSAQVNLEIESEDIIIETEKLTWLDKERVLSGGEEDEVNIHRANGTGFTGIGFQVNSRNRTWEFSGGANGTYIHDDDDKNEDFEVEDDDEVEIKKINPVESNDSVSAEDVTPDKAHAAGMNDK
jgi:LPS export ABC transporter protein LptC